MRLRPRHVDTTAAAGLSKDPDAAVEDTLPDPALPPQRRGDWDNAALTNVDITEFVKRQINTVTRPWNK